MSIPKELSTAMAKAFPEITGAGKNKENPHFRSKYADLGQVIEAIKPALANHGLWFYQVVREVPNCASVETIIVHESGESLSCGIITIPIMKMDAQGYGSALSYAKRYSLSTAFAVAQEDDDGNAACTKKQSEDRPKKVETEKKPSEPQDEASLQEMIAKRKKLIAELLEVTGMQNEEGFIKCLEKKEQCCIATKRSFIEELNRCIDEPEDTIEKYNAWKQKQVVKKEVDNQTAA